MTTQVPVEPRKLQPRRFALGLLLCGAGIADILLVGIRIMERDGAAGSLTLPLVASAVVTGVMLIGAGFAMMVAASPSFDDEASPLYGGDDSKPVE